MVRRVNRDGSERVKLQHWVSAETVDHIERITEETHWQRSVVLEMAVRLLYQTTVAASRDEKAA